MNAENYVFEWNLQQWAEAQAWFERLYGWSPLPDLAGANKVWAGWAARREDQPGLNRVVVERFSGWRKPEIARNVPWARRMFSAAMLASVAPFGKRRAA